MNCTCGNGFFGESCSIPYTINLGLNSWYTVSTGSSVFKPRSSHVAVYINNSLLVHGGIWFVLSFCKSFLCFLY